jgi:hypothetical protein
MTHRHARAASALLTVFVLLSQPIFAFQIPLSETAVREAYFLGQRNDQKTADLFKLYTVSLPLPDKGPYVSEIRLLTPYAQVVSNSAQHSIGYSAQQAAADYHGRGDTILVQVRIELTVTYTYEDAARTATDTAGELNRHLDPEDFWRGFRFSISQNDKSFEPSDVTAYTIYAQASGADNFRGTVVWLEFDANDFADVPAQVVVTTPAGLHSVATFDLENLR